jgi:hypothetical protein
MKFKYLQRVKVVSGFYRDQVGVVKHGNEYKGLLPFGKPEYRYMFVGDNSTIIEWFDESELEAIGE